MEPWWWAVGVYVLTQVAQLGRSEMRHKINSELLQEVRADVKRINGQVARHDAAIEFLRRED